MAWRVRFTIMENFAYGLSMIEVREKMEEKVEFMVAHMPRVVFLPVLAI